MKNGITLVTYADCMGNNLKDLNQVLKKYIGNGVDIIHILPFFPSTADRGFAPVRYDKVDEAFGDWEDISRIRENYKLTVDFMINHISRYSDYFNDFIEKKNSSEYRDMFIQYKDFWDNGEPTKEQVDLLFKRKPRAPYTEVEFADGSVEKIWCTFSEDQIDLDFRTDITKKYIRDVLEGLCEKDISVIRLDAFAYTTKYKNTNCFFVEPYIWDVLAYCRQILEPHQVEILPELHGHYGKRLEIAQRGYYVYDYALPMLVLYSLYSGESKRLADWLRICPRKQFTTLDTHDGIGVIDVQDLLSTEEINYTTEKLYEVGANVKKIYNSEAYNNLDIYQINCTYYSALGDNDRAYLLARAIQFFTPGIPQIYYVGMLCGKNDLKLLERTKEGRNINRHYYSLEEVAAEMKRPVVAELNALMKWRNTNEAFDGDIEVFNDKEKLEIIRDNGMQRVKIIADLKTFDFSILEEKDGTWKEQFAQ